ncbi:oligosaccharyl transferase, archaeosortase A system-associated [Methanospirillum lacunae]|uniref:dolichyl-phosphooligosaccharide-protein glycotransferase n=1 Tax=Methanospirillum lacunae TaxID=668570 RepID=A0A2V2MU32_9EURY|nr:oligosaccharyl transferase, archaeosortase A system-associated [Methanospirillum lacunae]PWR69830.1 oligosaccharyl transferase, archaeosortase A system-associated [Methanospirillum lacunae]
MQCNITRKNVIIGIILLILTILAFYLRMWPGFEANLNVISNVAMDDPMYNLRMVEQTVANFPHYAWFDPMTYYPQGQPQHWGPLFTLISAAACILVGATTRVDIASVCLFIPGIMAALMIPITYATVKLVSDWKSAIATAAFMTIVPGQYFFRSYYGYFDHHIGEVLFSTLFCLCYLYALVYCRKNPVQIEDKNTWKIPILLGLLCGFTYVLGLAIMPTMLVFALIVAIITPIWFMIQRYNHHLGASALVINTTTFIIAIIGFFSIGVNTSQLGMDFYSTGHPIAYGLIILGTWILFGFSYYLRKKSLISFVLAIIGVTILGIVLFALLFPSMFSYFLQNANAFFGQDIHWKTIQEARQWTIFDAWRTFNYSLFLFAGGILVLLRKFRREINPSYIFLLIWTGLILYATCEHIRYEYYMAVPIAMLSGIAVGSAIDLALPHKKQEQKATEQDQKRPAHSKSGSRKVQGTVHHQSRFTRGVGIIVLIIVAILSILFTMNAIADDKSLGIFQLNTDWWEACSWLENNTPDTGLDFYKIYNENSFHQPPESYGIMSWWDYGHIILELGDRLPNANPFQFGVDGENGAARFFVTTNESVASGIMDKLHTKYVMTDYEMDTDKFWAMATWDNPEIGAYPYQRSFILPDPDNPNTGQNIPFFVEPYYRTMVSRLHNFDGSMQEPNKVHYIQYMDPSSSHTSSPLIVNGSEVPYQVAEQLVKNDQNSLGSKFNSTLVNYVYTSPLSTVPALNHFRLVYESSTRASPDELPDVRYVKVFEYVPGAHLTGEGILEIPIITNTGRTFTYRQESVNGSFTLPYPTSAKVGDIQTLGPYKNEQTGKEYTVTEEQVQKEENIL